MTFKIAPRQGRMGCGQVEGKGPAVGVHFTHGCSCPKTIVIVIHTVFLSLFYPKLKK